MQARRLWENTASEEALALPLRPKSRTLARDQSLKPNTDICKTSQLTFRSIVPSHWQPQKKYILISAFGPWQTSSYGANHYVVFVLFTFAKVEVILFDTSSQTKV